MANELANVAAQERALLDECQVLLVSVASLQVKHSVKYFNIRVIMANKFDSFSPRLLIGITFFTIKNTNYLKFYYNVSFFVVVGYVQEKEHSLRTHLVQLKQKS